MLRIIGVGPSRIGNRMFSNGVSNEAATAESKRAVNTVNTFID